MAKPPDWPIPSKSANRDAKPVVQTECPIMVPDKIAHKKMYDFPSPVGAKLVVLASRTQPKKTESRS